MGGYNKLFECILDSTIWLEDAPVRLVWVTMLAMADGNGEIAASIPGLARRARVTLEECQEALEKFKSPDKFSRTTDFEGRRICDIDGGWRLLNHKKYRSMLSNESKRANSAARAKRYRDKKREEGWSNQPEGVTMRDAVTPERDSVTRKRDDRHASASASASAFASGSDLKNNLEQPSSTRLRAPEEPARRGALERVFERAQDNPDVQNAWNDYREILVQPNAKLSADRAELILERVLEGTTREQFVRIWSNAKRDEWLKMRRYPVKTMLGSQDQFEALLEGTDGGPGPSPEEVFG